MADYYPLISKAVAGLEKNTGEGRRALYERARKALVDQLRGVQPPLSETDITRERLALEESIRKVETEAVRLTRPPMPAPVAPRREPPPPPAHTEPPSAPPPRADEKREPLVPPPGGEARRERKWLDKRDEGSSPEAREGIKGFSDVVAEADTLGAATAQAGRSARETYSSVPSPSPEFDRIEPRIDLDHPTEDLDEHPEPGISEPRISEPRITEPRARTSQRPAPDRSADRSPSIDRQKSGERRSDGIRADLGPVIGERGDAGYRSSRTEAPLVPDNVRQAAERARRDFDDEGESDVKKPMFGWFAKTVIWLGVILIVLAAVGGGLYWQRAKLGPMFAGLFSRSSSTTTAPGNSAQAPRSTKIPDRVGQQDQYAGPQEAIVAQRVVLYEEDPSDPAGKRLTGTATWRAETAAPAPGQQPDRAVRGEINVPERGMQVVWSLRRNADKDLPASHTISIQFTLPPNFVHGGIAEIRGVLMKQAEQTRGVSLAGISVKVTNNFFLIGLSSTDADLQRNIQMLKERQWFDIAIVYTDGRRAILAVEKGTPGDRAFADAFAAWGQ